MEPVTRQVGQLLSHGIKELELDNKKSRTGDAWRIDPKTVLKKFILSYFFTKKEPFYSK
jgi:hypothetical protein